MNKIKRKYEEKSIIWCSIFVELIFSLIVCELFDFYFLLFFFITSVFTMIISFFSSVYYGIIKGGAE